MSKRKPGQGQKAAQRVAAAAIASSRTPQIRQLESVMRAAVEDGAQDIPSIYDRRRLMKRYDDAVKAMWACPRAPWEYYGGGAALEYQVALNGGDLEALQAMFAKYLEDLDHDHSAVLGAIMRAMVGAQS